MVHHGAQFKIFSIKFAYIEKFYISLYKFENY